MDDLSELNFAAVNSDGQLMPIEGRKLGCNYQGHEFGATYPDSVCIDGYLWDADSGDATEDGWLYTHGGDIPCPKCNSAEHEDYFAKD
jgi:hypothetical protein